jgi:hypothetical protein
MERENEGGEERERERGRFMKARTFSI